MRELGCVSGKTSAFLCWVSHIILFSHPAAHHPGVYKLYRAGAATAAAADVCVELEEGRAHQESSSLTNIVYIVFLAGHHLCQQSRRKAQA